MGQHLSKDTTNSRRKNKQQNDNDNNQREVVGVEAEEGAQQTADPKEVENRRNNPAGITATEHHSPPHPTTKLSTSFLAKLTGRTAGQQRQQRRRRWRNRWQRTTNNIKSGSSPSTEPLTASIDPTTASRMNARFPVESGESLSMATTTVYAAQQQQPAAAAAAPIAQRNGLALLNDQQQQHSTSAANASQQLPVWVYVIFRRNPSSGHDKVNVKDSLDGPVFWTRRVLYVFCCSCHFDRHEHELLKLLEQNKSRVERVCLVDRPLDYPFLPDSLFGFMANNLPRLEFVYLRELDLEKINRATVERLSEHRHLRKLIVHGCRNYEALQDFHNLPQLLVVKGNIQGLKAMLGCGEEEEEDPTAAASIMMDGETAAAASSSCGNGSVLWLKKKSNASRQLNDRINIGNDYDDREEEGEKMPMIMARNGI